MTCKKFTYGGDPSNNARDLIRFLIGDTIRDRPLFDDKEIDYQISITPNPKMAGYELLMAKARQYARLADVRVGDVSKSFSKLSDQMKLCAEDLKEDALKSAKPFFGGLTISGKKQLASNSNATQPQFALGMTDNPNAVQLYSDINNLISLVGVDGI